MFGMSNILFQLTTQDYFEIDSRLNPFLQTWSLGVEEQFYALYPLVLITISTCFEKSQQFKKKIVIAIISAGIISSVSFFAITFWSGNGSYYYNTLARSWEILTGCLIYFIVGNTNAWGRLGGVIKTIALIVLILIGIGMGIESKLIYLLAVILTGVIIASGQKNNNPILKSIFECGVITWIGNISYSLYLWHWGILSIISWTIGINKYTIIPYLVCTFYVSWLSYENIEKASWSNDNKFGVKRSLYCWLMACGGMLITLVSGNKLYREIILEQT